MAINDNGFDNSYIINDQILMNEIILLYIYIYNNVIHKSIIYLI